MLIAVLLLCRFALVVVVAKTNLNPSCWNPFERNPLVAAPFNVVGKDWMPFEYGKQGTEAHQAFMAVSESPMIVRLTDTLQPGASFILRDTAKRAILVTPTPVMDVTRRTVNPLRAYNSPAWSHGDAVLLPGFHQLRIFMRESPFGSGTGAIKVEEARLCKHRLRNLRVVENVVGWEEAGRLCEAFGMELANLYEYKSTTTLAFMMKRAFTLVKRCQVDAGLVWIAGSPDHDPDEEVFPASLQALSPVEGITGAEWENSRMPALCQIPVGKNSSPQ